METIKAGSWVQIHQIVLPAGERAPQVPEDTQKVPLELRVKGYLVEDGKMGEEVEIETFTGRRLKGTLEKVEPSYEHVFGKPLPEMLNIGKQLREMLNEEGVKK